MRVLYVLNATVMGGGNISLINMLKGMHQRGVEIFIVYPDKEIDSEFYKETKEFVSGYYRTWMHAYFHPRINNMSTKTKIKEKIKAFTEDFKINKIIKEVKPDIIHTNVGVIHTGYRCAAKNHIPHVWHLREYQTKDFDCIIEPSYDKFVQMVHQSNVITITKDILKYFKLEDSNKATCIYNGCCSENDICLDYPKEKYFLCCSRISKSKGHKEVVEAFVEFYKTHQDYKLIIAGFGDEEYIAELKAIVKNSHLEHAVQFVGYKDDVKPLMRKARALIVASACEGFGRMTAEAAFYGCLVIGKNSGGTKEILENTGGFLYDNDVQGLIEKMNEVAQLNDEQYKSMAMKAQAVAVKSYSNEQNVENIYKLYSKLKKQES